MITRIPAMLIATALLCAATLGAKAEDAPMLSFKQGENTQSVLIDGKPFTELVYGKTEQYGEIPRPFLYPIIGPTGAKMTRDFPMRDDTPGEQHDHTHHRSLWFAHGSVNAVDYWTHRPNMGLIKTRSIDPSTRTPSTRATLDLKDDWVDPAGKTVANDQTQYAFAVLPDGSRVIDIQTAIAPAQGVEQLVFGDTKEGTMAIRLAPQLRLKGEVATGHCINSEGDKDGACWGKRAKWVAYWGVIDGKTCGVAIFDHPTNLRHPTWWHARDYGLVAANPFGIHDFEKKPKGTGDYTLKAGQTLSLRYRFVFFAGDAEQADIAGKYEQWVKQTTPKKDQAGNK